MIKSCQRHKEMREAGSLFTNHTILLKIADMIYDVFYSKCTLKYIDEHQTEQHNISYIDSPLRGADRLY